MAIPPAQPCWFENGAVVVPAVVAGVAGDYLIDPSAPVTLLHDTRAQGAGFEATSLTAQVRLAGRTLEALPVQVVDLDARSAGFFTPIAGVIGADVLGRYVVDLDFSPCRIRLSLPGQAPRFTAAFALPLSLTDGALTLPAAVTDGRRVRVGRFALDLSAGAALRLSQAGPALPTKIDLAARNVGKGRIRALSFADRLVEQPSVSLAPDLDPALAGAIGNGVWSRYRLRIDLGRAKLSLARP
ncbi:hypothetical protein QO010_003828 [Caulobacter ginsengisoli]|uniref:Uncharacterized protein n=1 Tax=Caulobacter ginsengisoli TaxID=400775 RepID=A0ABU0IXD4_9CAUL|nr:hypothetical protein [Caulobacter ginsengisoli]MDQ0466035.1 hypothetical protein [Caulobacter ginsengisoli]